MRGDRLVGDPAWPGCRLAHGNARRDRHGAGVRLPGVHGVGQPRDPGLQRRIQPHLRRQAPRLVRAARERELARNLGIPRACPGTSQDHAGTSDLPRRPAAAGEARRAGGVLVRFFLQRRDRPRREDTGVDFDRSGKDARRCAGASACHLRHPAGCDGRWHAGGPGSDA